MEDILLFVGMAAVLGLFSGKMINKIKVPSVAGYVLVGVVSGASVLNIFSAEVLRSSELISSLALGFIAFSIGSEMSAETLKKLGKSVLWISVLEASVAFVLVFIAMLIMIGNFSIAIILASVASATAPAATLMVLQESRAKGVLTSTLMAVVAIDDGIALILYGFSSSIVKVVLKHKGCSIFAVIHPFLEIGGSILIGVLAGYMMLFLSKRVHTQGNLQILTVGMVLIVSGLATKFHFSELLSNMAFGVTVCNIVPARRRIFGIAGSITPPIYCMFFVLAGAHLQVDMVKVIGTIGVVFTIMRIVGKIGGAYMGGKISDAPKEVRNYLGLGLLSQIGVAIGLAVVVKKDFPPELYGPIAKQMSEWVINILLFTTIFTEIIGPLSTKFAINRAGEAGKA